jgi:hypothetical protein
VPVQCGLARRGSSLRIIDEVFGGEPISFAERAEAVGLRIEDAARPLPDASPQVLRVVRSGGTTQWVWVGLGGTALIVAMSLFRRDGGNQVEVALFAGAFLWVAFGWWFVANGWRTAAAIERSPQAHRAIAYVPIVLGGRLAGLRTRCTVVIDGGDPISFTVVSPPPLRLQGKPLEGVLLGHPAPGERVAVVIPGSSRVLVARAPAEPALWPPGGWQRRPLG